MYAENPIESLSASLYKACIRDLPDIEYQTRDLKFRDQVVYIMKTRRPYEHECDVEMWSQTWGSTALGFGGMGGASITSAYTVTVEAHNLVAVYFHGRFAYKLHRHKCTDKQKEKYEMDKLAKNLAACRDAVERYGAELTENQGA